MKIRKAYQGTVPENKILDTYSQSQTDTYSCNYSNRFTTYSTTEQEVGKWIDGKTIYRKTIQVTLPSNSNTWTTIYSNAISNFDNVISINGWFKSDSNEFLRLPMGEGQWFINLRLNSNGSLECNRNGWNNNIAYITLEYTKTS